MACDARTLFAERLLGDLHHDFLARLQHFGNELRTTGMSVSGTPMVAAILLIPATATRPTLADWRGKSPSGSGACSGVRERVSPGSRMTLSSPGGGTSPPSCAGPSPT